MKFLAFPEQILTEFSAPPSLALVLGNFDGVHVGHQALLHTARQAAAAIMVLTFKPHPVLYFKNQVSYLLTTYEQKADLLAHYGATYLCELDFTALHAMAAQDFIQRYLSNFPAGTTLVVGENFRFGKDAQGTPATLIQALPQFKVQVVSLTNMATPPEENKLPVSSGRIRNLITQGNLCAANLLLNHPYQIQGKVLHGQALGKQLNFPTANLALPAEQILPPPGVYISTMIYQGQRLPAISYLGTRPTIARDLPPLLETHLLSQDLDLYEQFIQVNLHLQLRPQLKFDSYSLLQDQITTDKHQAMNWHQEQAKLQD